MADALGGAAIGERLDALGAYLGAHREAWGVSPDEGLEVKWTPEEYIQWAQARRKRDLIAHGLDPNSGEPEAPAPGRPKDSQLDKALEVLRGKAAG